jgi:hypothetical protein
MRAGCAHGPGSREAALRTGLRSCCFIGNRGMLGIGGILCGRGAIGAGHCAGVLVVGCRWGFVRGAICVPGRSQACAVARGSIRALGGGAYTNPLNSTVRRRAAKLFLRPRTLAGPTQKRRAGPTALERYGQDGQECARESIAPDEPAGRENRNPPQFQRPRNSIPSISSIPPISKMDADAVMPTNPRSPPRGSLAFLQRPDAGVPAATWKPSVLALSPPSIFRPILIPQRISPMTRYRR